MGIHKLTLPTHLKLSKNDTYKRNGKTKKTKTYSLSLNQLKTWHSHLYNNLKIKFKESIQEQLEEIKRINREDELRMPIAVHLVFFPKRKDCDLDNFSS